MIILKLRATVVSVISCTYIAMLLFVDTVHLTLLYVKV